MDLEGLSTRELQKLARFRPDAAEVLLNREQRKELQRNYRQSVWLWKWAEIICLIGAILGALWWFGIL